MEEPWTKSPDDILQYYSVDPARGLSTDLAAKHAQLYGKNGTFSCCASLGMMLTSSRYQNSPKSLLRRYGSSSSSSSKTSLF